VTFSTTAFMLTMNTAMVSSVPVGTVVVLVLGVAAGVWCLMMGHRLLRSRAFYRKSNEHLLQEKAHLEKDMQLSTEGRIEQDAKLVRQREKTDELRHRSRTLERILAVSSRINATHNMAELVEKIVVAGSEISGFGKVVLHVWSEGTKTFEGRGFVGVSDEQKAALAQLQVTREEYDKLTHQRYRFSNSYLVREEMGDGSNGKESLADRQVWSKDLLLISPMVSRMGEVRGYLCLDEPVDGKIPTPIQIKHLEFLVHQATTALESAEVYDKLAHNNTELTLASKKLASLGDMKANFVANVSHELRTPLTSISAYAELLQTGAEKMSPEQQNDFLKGIHEESLRLTGVINDILDLNNMENKRAGLTSEATDMVAMVERLAGSWENRALEKSIKFSVATMDPDVLLNVDAVMFKELLGHLLNNAFKFTPEGGNVRLGLDKSGTAVKLTVEDSGIGIPEDQLGKIFDRFYQVDGSATREFNGQGVGLALCHEIVSHHDGRIWAENMKSGGARFTVLMPCRPEVVQPADMSLVEGGALEPGEFMQRLMHWVSESLGVQVATLMMPDADDDHLSIQAAIGLPESVVQSTHVRKGAGISGKVWARGETIFMADISREHEYNIDVNEPRYTTPSLLSVPLIDDGVFVGVLSVNNKIGGRLLDEDDRLFLESMSLRIAHVLRKHRNWQVSAQEFRSIRDTLRLTTAVGHLRHESLMEICQEICLATARTICMAPEDMANLAFSLQFYDVGLSCIPPHLLNKPGPFNTEEQRYVQKHVGMGLGILDSLKPGSKVRQIILHHHENYDGTGYPDKLEGEAIPLGSRLVRLTDTLAALLSTRPWRSAFSLDEAMDELHDETGRKYCPRMADIFLVEAESRRERIEALQNNGHNCTELSRPALDRRGIVSHHH
jgi:signal transduction histidine kinase/putative methionine-R-sulfoxide reductase with GAF domain